ncbi:MAG: L-fucose/L-arabinose isomerase family protein [Clostridia bacterium]|nr:L-fucose/L-arabinose isomerase family protein [Clostridia bacterium]
MIERKRPRTARVGFFAVGHAAYWGQFDGLLDSLLVNHAEVGNLIRANGVELTDLGMIDSSEKAFSAADRLNSLCPDLIFCDMVTYATSSTFTPIIRNVTAPVVLVALQPLRRLDYTKADTFMQLQNDNVCSVPEFMCAAERMGKTVPDVIIGTLTDDPQPLSEIAEWCDIAKVLHDLRGARIGLMGHVMEAMYDMHTDPAALAGTFGIHVPLLEIDNLCEQYEKVTGSEIAEKTALIRAEFDIPEPKQDPVTSKLTDRDLYEAARNACALDRLIEEKHLDGLAYYYEGTEGSLQRRVASSLIVGNSILNAQGFPMCGEFDVKTCVAMLIMDRLDIGGSFAELHPFDFDGDYILVGHDGPHHLRVAEGRPILRSLKKYHGKPGCGASVEFKLREGPITMLGITQKRDGAYKFVIGEGYSGKGDIPPTGNTNTRGFFPPSTREFVKAWCMEGPTHHFALGVGHKAAVIEKIGRLLGVETVVINRKFNH